MLDNRYRLTTPIATGGMGEVWRAMEVSLGRVVAVKLLRPELLADPEFDARFQAEARTMAGLTHPNVVTTTVSSSGRRVPPRQQPGQPPAWLRPHVLRRSRERGLVGGKEHGSSCPALSNGRDCSTVFEGTRCGATAWE
jgi:serine/threonine protein kinase